MDPPPLPKEEESTDETKQEYRVLVALDFGTYWTSVAYWDGFGNGGLLEKISGKIRMVQQWPTTVDTRVPTEISYTSSPKGRRQWGFDIDEDSKIHRWLRVGLEERRTKEELESLVVLIDEATMSNLDTSVPPWLYKSPEQTAQDYLRYIAEHVRDDFLAYRDERLLHNVPFDLVVSYPPLWSDANKRRYFNVVKSAFGSTVFPKLRHVYFVSETEAIAHWGILSQWRGDSLESRTRGVYQNTSVIVCDTERSDYKAIAAAYRISAINNDEFNFQLRQVGYLSKADAGWALVNKAFVNLAILRLGLRNKVDPQQDPFVPHVTQDPTQIAWRIFCSQFQPIKIEFDGSDRQIDQGYLLDLPTGRGFLTHDRPEMGIMDGALTFSTNDLKEFFDPSVNTIIQLLSHQIELADHAGTPVKTVALTGSFANQPYVSRRITEFGQSRRIEIIGFNTTTKGSIAWVLGSATALPVSNLSLHAGVVFSEPFEETKHKLEDRQINATNGKQRASGQIKWLLTKGEAIFNDTHEPRNESLGISRRFRLQDCVPGTLSRVVFVTCSADTRPSRIPDLEPRTSNIYELDFELSLIPGTERQAPPAKGRLFERGQNLSIDITLSMDVQVNVSGIKFSVSCGGKLLVEKSISHP